MDYKYILFPFVVWFIAQTIKFCIRLLQSNVPKNLKTASWIYLWAGGMPSTHTAIITSALVLIWHEFGDSSIFIFSLAVTLLMLYNLVAARKTQEVIDDYYVRSTSTTLRNIVKQGLVLDLAGHTLGEVIWGAILGVALGAITILLHIF